MRKNLKLVAGEILFLIQLDQRKGKQPTSRRVYKYPHQIKKTLWYGRVADPDFHTPPAPHLHSADGKEKLDVYTGKFYSTKTKSYTGAFADDEVMQSLWTNEKFLRFVDQARKHALEQCSTYELPPIPSWAKRDIPNCSKTNGCTFAMFTSQSRLRKKI